MARIYVLIDPRDGDIRYVGLTIQLLKERYKVHISTRTPKKAHCASWIKHLQNAGYQPEIRLVQEVPDEHVGAAEVYWISYFRSIGCRLVNHTDGGEGIQGYCHSAETRAKMSASRTGKPSNNGERTKERWERWRAEGGKVPEETARKISEAKKGHVNSPEHNAKIGAGQRGRKKSAETKAKMAASARAYWEKKRLSEA